MNIRQYEHDREYHERRANGWIKNLRIISQPEHFQLIDASLNFVGLELEFHRYKNGEYMISDTFRNKLIVKKRIGKWNGLFLHCLWFENQLEQI